MNTMRTQPAKKTTDSERAACQTTAYYVCSDVMMTGTGDFVFAGTKLNLKLQAFAA